MADKQSNGDQAGNDGVTSSVEGTEAGTGIGTDVGIGAGTDASSDPVADERTALMIEAVNQIMPFGKFKGSLLLDLPEPYIVWFKQSGFPQGKLGRQMALVYEIKLNGLEKVFRPLIQSR